MWNNVTRKQCSSDAPRVTAAAAAAGVRTPEQLPILEFVLNSLTACPLPYWNYIASKRLSRELFMLCDYCFDFRLHRSLAPTFIIYQNKSV